MGRTADALLRLGIEGASEFQSTLKRESDEVRKLKEEYRVLSTGFSDTDKSAGKFEKQVESLTKVLEAQRKKQQEIQNMLDKLKSTTDDADKETDEYKTTVAQLEHQLNQATIEANKTERQIDGLNNEMDEAEKESKKAGGGFSKMKEKMTEAIVSGQLLADALKTVTKFLVDVAKDAIEYNAQLEQAAKTMEVFIGADQTEQLVDHMKELSLVTGQSTIDLLNGAKGLIAMGANADQASKAVEGMSKMLLVMGADGSTANSVMSNLQQILSKGKADATDMKQFLNASIPIWDLLSESTGKSVDELQEMDITFDMIADAMSNATSEGGKYYEAVEAGADTLNGQWNQLKITVQEGLGTAFESVNQKLETDVIPRAKEFVENIDWDAVGTAVAAVAEVLGVLAEVIAKVLEVAGKAIGWFSTFWNARVEEMYGTTETTNAKIESNVNTTTSNVGNAYITASNDASGAVHDMTTGIETDITGMNDKASGWATDYGKQYGDTLEKEMGNVTNNAAKWGEDFNSEYARGMRAGHITGAASWLAGQIKALLHFSEPDKGPLVGFKQWPKDFVSEYAQVMEDNVWRIEAAARDMARAMASPVTNINNDGRTINMSIYQQEGQDAEALADYVLYKLNADTERLLRA